MNYLKSFDFDELLEPVDNVEIALVVVISDVARVEPAVGVDHLLGGFRVVPVALHDLRAGDVELALLVRSQSLVLGGLVEIQVDDLGLGAGYGRPAGAEVAVAQRRHHDPGGRLRESVALLDVQVGVGQPLQERGARVGRHWCRSTENAVHPAEGLGIEGRVLGQDGRQ